MTAAPPAVQLLFAALLLYAGAETVLLVKDCLRRKS